MGLYSVSFRILMKGGQKYVNSNFGGARNRGAKRPVTHEVGHMLGGSGGMLPQKILRFLTPWNQFSCNMSSNSLNFILRLSVQTLMRDLHVL